MTDRSRRGAFLVVAFLAAVGLVAWLLLRERADSATTATASGAAAVKSPAEPPSFGAPAATADALVAPLAAADEATAVAGDAPATGTLVIRVIWATDRTPAANVGVYAVFWDTADPQLGERDGLTDAAGRWEIADAPAGRASVYLDRANGDNALVRAGETAELLLEIPAGILVRGLVVDPAEKAEAGADVWMQTGGAGKGFVVARSAADGRFTLRDVGAQSHIGALATGHVPSLLVTITDDGSHACDVTLRLCAAGAHLAGRVRDSAGTAVAGAVVLVGPEDGWQPPEFGNRLLVGGQPPRRAITDAQGAFAVRDVPSGKTPVAARAPGHSLWRGWADLHTGDNEALDVVLPDSATLGGVVTDAGGQPVAGATVETDTWGEMDWLSTESAADGRYELKDLPLGALKLKCVLKGLGKELTQVDVAAGARLEWNPRLTPGLQIVGRVVDANGVPVGGQHVSGHALVANELTSVQADTDQQGRFLLINCADAEHELSVYTPDWQTALASRRHVRPGPDEVVLQVAEARRSAFFVGRVLDVRSQVPELASVSAWNPQANGGDQQTIRADTGEFRLGPLLPGTWDLYLLVSGHSPRKYGRFVLAADETHDLGTIVLPDPGRVRLHVALPEGVAPVNVMVLLGSDQGPTEFLRREDDAVPVWLSEPVDPGDYELHVFSPSPRVDRATIMSTRAKVHVEANEESKVELTAERGVVLHVELTTSRAEPPAVEVRILDATGAGVGGVSADWQAGRTGTSERTGHAFLVERPGPYTLMVHCEGQVLLQQAITLPEGANAAPDVHVVVP